jgi:uncharacterized SAM-binding protein YcdF (DUF218 family)
MVYSSLPGRKHTTRWRRAGHQSLAFFDGVLALIGIALWVDAVRSLFTPDASLLGILVRWPGGRALGSLDAALLGTAFLVRHRVAALVLVAHLVLAVLNVAEFYALRAHGLVAAALPFSLATVALLVGAISRTLYDGPSLGWRSRVAGALVAGPLLILMHLFSFGMTDYTRTAEAIVVFGARVYEDGSASLALEDRVKHGVRLFHAGAAPRLVLSGASDEVPAMVRLALRWGVPEEAIVADPEGVNTYATVANLKVHRVVAVSHYYHLARIKLVARRLGIECATVPCPMTRRLAKEPYFVARECAAFVSYYLFRG